MDDSRARASGLLGIRATLGPLQRTKVPLRPGLTALYGLNGAGKSNILEAARIGISGLVGNRSADIELHFQDDELFSMAEGIYTPDGLRFKAAPRRSPHDWFRDYDLSERADQLREEVLHAWRDHSAGAWAPLVDELVLEGRFALVPVGVREPLWQVWLCALPTPHTPELIRAMAEFEARRLALPDVDSEDVAPGSEADADVEWLGNHPLLPAGARPYPLNTTPADDLDGPSNDQLIMFWLEDPEFLNYWYDGMPAPVALLGTIKATPWRVAGDVDLDTARAMARSAGAQHLRTLDDLDPLRAWAAAFSRRTRSLLDTLLLDPPHLHLGLNWPGGWVEGDALVWSVEVPGRALIGLDWLSKAEQKWTAFALQLSAMSESDSRAGIWLLDEPEGALHRSAEDHMARGLTRLPGPGEYWLVATHSPALLDDPNTHVLRVHSTQGGTRVEALRSLERSSLSGLGLRPSDLLQRWRVILLVEGHHDELLIRELLGDELQDARVHIVQVDGASQLAAAVDSQLLWDFTDSVVIPVVDNAKAEQLKKAWEEALLLAAAEGTAAAVRHLTAQLPGDPKSNETRWIRQFLIKSISKGDSTYSRVDPFAFGKLDITDYLPVGAMLPEAPDATWESIRADQQRMEHKSSGFKGWLAKRYGREIFTDEAIRTAARQLDVPEEFRLLLQHCRMVTPKDRGV